MKWTTRRLEDVADFCLGKMLDDKKNRGEHLPYLANVNVRWGEFDLENLREMRFEHSEMDRYGLRFGDIVMCEGGEPGRCAIWKEAMPGMMIQKALHRIRPRACLDYRFLFYSFLYKGRIGNFAALFTGATIKHLPREQLAKLEISFPGLELQSRIADILSAYDDSIANNRRRMALLEQAARELYREWFVRLRFPGHEHTRMINAEPQGWERKPLGACARFLSGGTPSKTRSDFWAGDVPWVSSGELTAMRIHRTTYSLTPEAIQSGSRLVPKDTILAVVRGMSLAKEFRIGLTSKPMAFNQDIKAIIPEMDVSTLLLYHALDAQRDQIRDKATEASHGTKKIDSQVLSEVELLVPPQRLQQQFNETAATLHTQWDVLENQNHRLRHARDLLLPRLMSGQIAV